MRTHNRLKTAGIQIVSELVHCSVGNLVDAGLSHESILEVRETLESVGLDLRPGIDHPQVEGDEQSQHTSRQAKQSAQ